jgi:queuine/archaeosine tRNA-ribosyltransferase
MRRIRETILDGSFASFRREFVSSYRVWNGAEKDES